MKTSPPNPVEMSAALSVSKRGKIAPNPSAIEAIAKVIITMVTIDSSIMIRSTRRMTLVPTVSATASTSSGVMPTQYYLHGSDRKSSGDDGSSHNVRPSRPTDGKMKRAATAASTNPASPRLRNETMLIIRKVSFSPLQMGSTLML